MPIVTKAPGTSSRDLLTIAAIGGAAGTADETKCEIEQLFRNMTNLERGEGRGGEKAGAKTVLCANLSTPRNRLTLLSLLAALHGRTSLPLPNSRWSSASSSAPLSRGPCVRSC